MAAARVVIRQKVNMVIGTTGLSDKNLAEIGKLCQTYKTGAVVAPNFSLGAALLIHLSKSAAKFFNYAEIVEMHHDKKADAPSGTAIATAKAMAQVHRKPFVSPELTREVIKHTRGGEMEGIAIHSLRLPGFMSGQEVIFSGILAIKEVTKRKGLTLGLESLLKL